jgi:hypothetical protein
MSLLNPKQPLGLPQGSVRALLALGLVAAAIFGFTQKMIPGDQFVQLVTMAAAFYFLDKRNGESGA